MKFPRIKKRMFMFAGCDIGERRLGVLENVFAKDEELKRLLKQGLLSATQEDGRLWFALTLKGKQHVSPLEKRWSAL